MNTFVFCIISIITIALSEICHPPIEWWVPVSAVAWALILISLAVAFFVRKKSKAALNAGLVAFFIFWEYAIISVFSFIRIFDDLMSDPIEEKVAYGIGAIVFLIIANFANKKLGEIAEAE
jgi:FtsH-binding integral membrane protein